MEERERERERELVKEEVLSFFSQNGSMVASTEYESLFSGQRYTKRMEGEFFIIGQTKIDENDFLMVKMADFHIEYGRNSYKYVQNNLPYLCLCIF